MTIQVLPSPKRSADSARASGPFDWYRFYAMFSEAFVRGTLAAAALKAGSVVLDPWLGTGTTSAVAAASGFRTLGTDINPVMVTVARGRCVTQEKALLVLEKVQATAQRMTLPKSLSDDPLLQWFHPAAVRGFRHWKSAIDAACSQEDGTFEADYLLTSLFEATTTLAQGHRSKNPTWVKRPPESEKAQPTIAEVNSAFLEIAQRKLKSCLVEKPAYVPDLRVGSSASMSWPTDSVDFALTSPPYCTRIDYAISTRIELALLGVKSDTMADLRDECMGTSTIRPAVATISKHWGESCGTFLKAVQNHSSKASKSYYYKTHLQYFNDLYRSLSEIDRCLRVGGSAVIVVQDSYYKEIHTDLPRIVKEMAKSFEWRSRSRYDYPVERSMRSVNTRSRRYRVDVPCTEAVLWFTK